ncbi:MAG: aromatic-L-amino-acid decarboxylase [Ignavibacteria bacterium]|nr:aromatic-L-amino-acid decarboxylase [Ignavibacteria bacterium]
MNSKEFRQIGKELIDKIADYFDQIEDYPVKSQVKPGEILGQIPSNAPVQGEEFPDIIMDFDNIIMPGMTHWQHPRFFAYFTANNSFPSLLGEMLTAALGAQCMIWETSPAAAELEEAMMNWLRDMIGLPKEFTGCIQDTASTATLVSILTARESRTNYHINHSGFGKQPTYRLYCSTEAHSSIEKAAKIAGIGRSNVVKIPVDSNFAMVTSELEYAIKTDINNGNVPLAVIAAFGTTSTTAIDPIDEIGEICRKYSVWLHVDAAFAGSALVLPEIRPLLKGMEYVDTFVFNPHKWMFTNFDCSAYFVRNKETLIRTFEIMPEYLKTGSDSVVNNYRDWGIQLGRRFRALKLWFVLRSFGVEGIQSRIREHIILAEELRKKIEEHSDFEIAAPSPFNLVCFRYKPHGIDDINELNELNESLHKKLNATGKIYLTHTKLNNLYTLRMVIGQTNVSREHVEFAWELICKMVKGI